MSDCRKDSKGRKLRSGESQRSDGRYTYKYTPLELEDAEVKCRKVSNQKGE